MAEAKNLSSGLLIGVVRNITNSQSIDQKDIVKQQLEQEFAASGKRLDKLLTEHKQNVLDSLGTFRVVSKDVRACREKIKSVQNSLQISHSLLQSRRDELKKLWLENLEQKKVCEILQQIHEIKNLDRVVDGLIKEQKFHDAVQQLKRADILLNGPLSIIEGLAHLRTKILTLSQDILQKIIENLLQWLIVDPFDKQMLEIARTLNETTASESIVCMRLLEKYAPGKSVPAALANINVILANDKSNQLHEQIVKAIHALAVFDQMDTALEQLFLRAPALCKTAVNDTIGLLSLATELNTSSDIQPLVQLVQILIHQIRNSFNGHKMLATELKTLQHSDELHDEVVTNFWKCMQEVLENVISDHIDIYPASQHDQSSTQKDKIKSLFKFANTAHFSSAGSAVAKSNQPIALICQPDPYNIVKIYYTINRFCAEIEEHTRESHCELNKFLNAFVMDIFVEKIRKDFDKKIDQGLLGTDVWTSLSNTPVQGHNMKILTSCIRIFELCQQIGNLIKNMDTYTQRFASLWVLIMEEYTKSATAMYQRITHSRAVQGENMIEHSKISATWAVDEDISRLLKSLPSWTVIINQTPAAELTPTGILNLNESEQQIRQRTQRESEILISNLGVQKEIDRLSVITDLEHIRAIVCMHESLQWFCSNMNALIVNIPRKAKDLMKCKVHIRSPNGEVVEDTMNSALHSRLKSLEAMSETCLLMMHLELRVHCFFHLLPLAKTRPIVIQEDSDPEVIEFGRDIRQIHQLLSSHIAANKVKYLFDGLGHLCASIFINSSQHITKLPEAGQKRFCRNIFTVQRHLSQISGRPETELNRAITFYDFVNRDPDELLALVMERGADFTYMEYTHLLALAIRTNPVLCSQRGVLDAKLKQLQEILSKVRR